jgi:biopolymer transport protein ExbD
MPRKVKKIKEENPGINMTALIDIVFQLVIFFIATVKMEEDRIDRTIKLSMSPNGPPIHMRDARTVTINVDKNGTIAIRKMILTPDLLRGIMARTVSVYGSSTPVVIVGDGRTQHKFIRKVMDSCSSVGIWKMKFLALKQSGESKYAISGH